MSKAIKQAIRTRIVKVQGTVSLESIRALIAAGFIVVICN